MAENTFELIDARDAALSTAGLTAVPALVANAGPGAAERFVEFFAARIANPNTRVAYARAALRFLTWCEQGGFYTLTEIQPVHVATYIRELAHVTDRAGRLRYQAPTIKQQLAAIRQLFDWLVVGQVMPANPASPVRGPKHVVKTGKTPVLSADVARALFARIDTDSLVGLRDRALLGVLTYAFARVGATIAMRVEDYYCVGKRARLRLHEKGGKYHEMPAHHKLEDAMAAYIEAAGILSDPKGPLFRSARGRTGTLTNRPMRRSDVYAMIRRRGRAAGITTRIGCHTFRATGITDYLMNGGSLEYAQQMAAHESPRTTKLYDRRNDEVALDEVEKIQI